MIRGWTKLVALFLGYASIGFSGDYVATLLAGESSAIRGAAAADVEVVGRRLSAQASGSCAYGAELVSALGANAGERLRVAAGSGELRVEGVAGAEEVRAVGRACTSEPEWLDALQLTLEREEEGLVLTAHYPDRSRRSGWGSDYARIGLVIEVPMDMAVDVQDGSGGMEITGTGALRIDDSSGSILVRGVGGPVSIDDGSGGIEVRDVAGAVEIEDGSGEVDLSDVEGDVIVRDGSGSIRAVEVEGSVVVERDGSGSIRVRDVRGDFRVGADGSGGIDYSGVDGTIDVPREERARRGG